MPTLLNATDQFDYLDFRNVLPIPGEIDATKPGNIVLEMAQSDVQMGLYDVATGEALTTTVWGYSRPQDTPGYLGPTILAEEDNPVTIIWRNNLPTDNDGGHLLGVDFSLHRANPDLKPIQDGFIPTVPHLHGGETNALYDGYPEAWWTQLGAAQTGDFYAGTRYTYDNDQQAAPLWYHDHALGLTRLNVYAGLAGVYDLTDENERELKAEGVLPDVEVPLVIQDKAFTEDGALYYPAFKNDELPDGAGGSGSVVEEVGNDFFANNPLGDAAASALPEFAGDHIVVNGAAWPNITVSNDEGESAYEFDLLNGSDSRFYVLDFVQVDENGDLVTANPDISVLAVAGDGGLLPTAVDISSPISNGEHIDDHVGAFILAPGDRLGVMIDFADLNAGDQIRLANVGPAYEPFKGFETPGDLTSAPIDNWEPADLDDPVGNIMQFTVDPNAADVVVGDAATVSGALNTDASAPEPTEDANGDPLTRKVGLFEGADEYGRVQPLLGTAKAGDFHTNESTADGQFGPLNWIADTTENPKVGTTETWEVYNFTADAHPVHLHLTQFEVKGRYEIQFKDEDDDGVPDNTDGELGIEYGSYNDPDSIDFDKADIWVKETSDPLAPEEGGRQDTSYVQAGWRDGSGVDGANIGQMLEFDAFFEKEGLYVWHCHILSHEDHEMMRPMEVMPEGFVDPFLDDAFIA